MYRVRILRNILTSLTGDDTGRYMCCMYWSLASCMRGRESPCHTYVTIALLRVNLSREVFRLRRCYTRPEKRIDWGVIL